MLLNNHNRTIITGANGFIGTHLVHHLHQAGYSVVAWVHHLSHQQLEGVEYVLYDMASGLDHTHRIHAGDIFIHCAYHPTHSHSPDLNLTGLQLLLQETRRQGAARHIFFSSMAARENTTSAYGQYKYQASLLFGEKDAVLTTGLVIGSGGLFKRTLSFIRNTTCIPTVQGGNMPLYYVGIDEVVQLVHEIIRQNLHGHFLAAHPEPATYISLYRQAAKKMGIKTIRINVPVWLMKQLIWMNSGLKKPWVTRDNLNGLLELKKMEDIEKYQVNTIPFRALEDTLSKL